MDTTCLQNWQIWTTTCCCEILTSRKEDPMPSTEETFGLLYWDPNGPQGLSLWQHDDDDDERQVRWSQSVASTWRGEKGSADSWWGKGVCTQKNNMLVQASEALSIVSVVYGVNPTAGTALEIFWEKGNSLNLLPLQL